MTTEPTVLHEKYRPTKFKDVWGQAHIIPSLMGMISTRTSHAFLFTGPAGCGKTSLARICATKLGCHPSDIREIDGATHTGVDDMRKLQEQLHYKPMAGEVRAIIIDEVHRISRNAFDSLLKVFEEPPRHLFWLMCTTAPDKVPATIRSRCSMFAVKPLNHREMIEFVTDIADKEGLATPDEVLSVVATHANGSMRKALVALAQCATYTTRKEANRGLEELDETDAVLSLCRMVTQANGSWFKALALLDKLDGEPPEGIRLHIVNYAAVVLKKATKEEEVVRLLSVLDNFQGPYNESEKLAPLLVSLGRTFFSGEDA